MDESENPSGGAGSALSLDTSSIIRKVHSRKEALALPAGSVVGDNHGGLTFSDAVAAALECRSMSGWRDVDHNCCESLVRGDGGWVVRRSMRERATGDT